MSRRTAAIIGLTCVVLVAAGLVIAALVGGGSDAGRSSGRWSAPQPVPVPAGAAATARAAFDSSGRAQVAWTERRGGRWSLFTVERRPGGDWSSPQAVVQDRPFPIYAFDLVGNARGDSGVLWTYRGRRRSVLVASVRGPGEAWQPEQALSRVRSLTGGRMGIDEVGAVTVTGRGLAGPGLWAVRHDRGAGWRLPVRISPPGIGTDAPALSVGADGRATVVALQKEPGRPRVLFSVSADPAGEWGPARVLPGSSLARVVSVLRSGPAQAIAVWGRKAGTQRRRGHALRLARQGSDGRWADPVVLDGPGREEPGSAVLVAKAGGGALVAWPRWDGRPEARQASIRAVEVPSSGPPGQVERVASLTMPEIEVFPGSVVFYGPPFVYLAAAGAPLLTWSEPLPAGANRRLSRIVESSPTADGAWAPPQPIGRGERSAVPLASGSAPGYAGVVWAEAPPGGPADEILLAERLLSD